MIITLGEFIIKNESDFPYSTGELSRLLNAIRLAAKTINHNVNKAGLIDIFGDMDTSNSSGEPQQKLDVVANQLFIQSLKNREIVCGIASEEEENFISVNNDKQTQNNSKYIVYLDPIDGSSNIDVNVSVGTIFSIYRRISPSNESISIKDFLQKGSNQVAAGYIIYGTSTMLVYTTGNGVNGFTLNPALGTFYLSHPNLEFPSTGNIISINEGNYRGFKDGIKKFLNHCKYESSKPFTSRYIGSLVSDFHRNLIKGGIYLYPETKNYKEGKLRLMYECNPLAFLAKQADGKASNGFSDILNLSPEYLHQRTPFFCGSRELVNLVENYLQ